LVGQIHDEAGAPNAKKATKARAKYRERARACVSERERERVSEQEKGEMEELRERGEERALTTKVGKMEPKS
jgi:hypothetical protein